MDETVERILHDALVAVDAIRPAMPILQAWSPESVAILGPTLPVLEEAIMSLQSSMNRPGDVMEFQRRLLSRVERALKELAAIKPAEQP